MTSPAGRDAQIEILRVLCIVCMIWVHVPPGLGAPSAVSTGAFGWLGNFLGQGLGRASVSALSFASGYLLWTTRARSMPPGRFVRSRAEVLLLPMAVWGLIYIGLAAAKAAASGEAMAGLAGVFDGPLAFVNAVTGLAGPTANYTIFFIRDLFVSVVILRLCAPWLPRFGFALLGLAFAMRLGQFGAPLVFRPEILLFATAGAMWAVHGGTLRHLTRPRVAWPAVLAGMAAWSVAAFELMPAPLAGVAAAAGNVGLRVALTIVFAALALTLSPTDTGRRIAGLGGHTYLGYLFHVPLLGVLWAIWTRWVAGPVAPSYLLFYLGCPFLVMGVAVLAGRVVDLLPATLQLLLRGKASRPVSPRIPAARPATAR